MIDMIEVLKNGEYKFATKGFPQKFNPENYLTFKLTLDQFKTTCTVVSGNCSELTDNDPLGFILSREEDLALNHNEGYNYCDFGFVDDSGIVHIWYETTSGTLLTHSFNNTDHIYECYLPNARLNGYHNMLLDMIKSGMTLTMYTDWYNCECFRDRKIQYIDKMKFWNTAMVSLGYPEMESYDSHWNKVDERRAAHSLHSNDEDDDYEDHEDYEDYEEDCE